jgi:hypothetical protein
MYAVSNNQEGATVLINAGGAFLVNNYGNAGIDNFAMFASAGNNQNGNAARISAGRFSIRNLIGGTGVTNEAMGINLSYWNNSANNILKSYGIYMDTSIDVGNERWAIYSLSTSPSLFSGRLQLGGTTSSFAGLKGSGTQLQCRLADDSNFCDFGVRQLFVDATITSGGTTGNQTINKALFSVNFAASSSTLTVTNNLVTTSSLIICTVQTNDATLKSVAAVTAAGSVTLYANQAATAETKVACNVFNQ